MFAHVDLVFVIGCFTLEQDSASVSCVFTIPRRFSIGFKPSELPGNVLLPQKLGTFFWHNFLASLNVVLARRLVKGTEKDIPGAYSPSVY